MIAIHERYPETTIVPAHDPSAYADIPRLPSSHSRRLTTHRASPPVFPPTFRPSANGSSAAFVTNSFRQSALAAKFLIATGF